MSKESLNDTISHYKSLEYIPMYNYYAAEEKEDLRYLFKLDDYEDMPEVETEYLNSAFDDMRFEVQDIAIKYNRKAEIIDDKQKEIINLNNKFVWIQQTIPFLSHLEAVINSAKGEEFEQFKAMKSDKIKTLEEYGFKIRLKADYFQELKRIQKQSYQLQTKVNIKTSDLKVLTGDGGDKKNDIYSEVESVGRYLNQEINMHTTTMRMWLTKKYKVHNETQRKALKNGR